MCCIENAVYDKVKAVITCFINRVATIGRNVLGLVCASLILADTKEGSLIWLCLVMIFTAIGRVSEPSDASWALCRWDHERKCLEMKWQCIKTLQQKHINFFRDFRDPKVCFYSACAAYLIMSDAVKRRQECDLGYEFIFPELAAMGHRTNVASKITGWIKMLLPGAINRYLYVAKFELVV
jgi:hypothetical protein